MIQSGISKIKIGILDKPNDHKDDLINVANRIVSNLDIVNVPIESVVRFILMAAEQESVSLEWNSSKKLFRRLLK
jgi:hypothetical protein